MPEPSCCSRPEPCELVKQVDGRRERKDVMLEFSRNGTLLLVFGMLPPWNKKDNSGCCSDLSIDYDCKIRKKAEQNKRKKRQKVEVEIAVLLCLRWMCQTPPSSYV
ncbi:hypothetical protein RUM43_003079 [Polyplax serrata]|uniref:Uncharacterized protein n=1 Tax=Polyplax serrata TaxID=468196 RepID=A0AAN8PNM8_POLSC